MRRNRQHIKLNMAPDATAGEGWLMACEANMVVGNGRMESWDGYTVLQLMREIVAVHGRLRTAHTSVFNLNEARINAERSPYEAQFDSEFVRELILSAMGISDTGYLHTRDEGGLRAAQEERKRPYVPKEPARNLIKDPELLFLIFDEIVAAMKDACVFVREELGYTDKSMLGEMKLEQWEAGLKSEKLGVEALATAVLDVCSVHVGYAHQENTQMAYNQMLGNKAAQEWRQSLFQ